MEAIRLLAVLIMNVPYYNAAKTDAAFPLIG